MTPLNITFIILLLLLAFFFGSYWKEPQKELGFVSNDPAFSQGGILTFAYRVPLRGATTTPCSLRSPAATSTIVHASVDVLTLATTSAITVDIGKAANNSATTTLLASLALAANATGTLVATSTLDTNDNLVIGPSNYVNVRFGRSYSSAPQGNCEVIFRVI